MKKLFNLLLMLILLPAVFAATIVTETTEPEPDLNVLQQTYLFFANNWLWILACLIIVIFGVIIYVIWTKGEDERKERDDPGYQLYKNTVRACELQRDRKRIKKTYSIVNLLWLGLPFVWNEHSAKILNASHELIGWYRGHVELMDDTLCILCYRTKTFIFFESKFLIKIPLDLKWAEASKTDKDDKGKPKMVEKFFDARELTIWQSNLDIRLVCSSIERLGLYYYCPVFEGNDGAKIDFRPFMEGIVMDNSFQIMVQRYVNTGARQMEKGIQMNPRIKQEMMSPQKTKGEAMLDEMNTG